MLAVSCLQVAAKYEEAEENVPAVTQLSRASGMGLTIQTVQRWEVAVLEGLGWQLTCIVPLHFLDYYLTRGLLFQGEALRGRLLPPLRLNEPSAAAAAAAAGTGSCSGSSPASSRPSTPAGGISSNSSGGSGSSKGPTGGTGPNGGGGPSAAAAQQLRKYAHFFAQHLAVHEFGGTGHLRPSFLAALVAFLARTVVGVAPTWRPELAALTGYEEAQLLPLAQQVLRGYREAYPHHAHHGAALSSSQQQQQQHHHQHASGGGLTLGVFGVFGGGAAAAAGSGGGGGFAASLCIPDPPPFDYHWVGRGVTTAV